MQGARTTRGCMNCRRRKKGCDFTRPACGRCSRLGIECRYEERRYTFMNATSEPLSTTGRESLSTAPVTILNGPLQSSLVATDSALQINEEFWNIYFPTEDVALDGSIGGVHSAPWIPAIRTLAQQDARLRNALHAVAFAGVGWMQNDYDFVQQARKSYALALRSVNLALQDPESAQDDAVLASVRVLGMFELFRRSPAAPNAEQGQILDWQSHVNGTCRLIQLRGRDKNVSGNGSDLYSAIRFTALVHGIALRTPNAVTAAPWSIPRRNTLRDDLFDIVGIVPDLYQRSDRVKALILAQTGSGVQEDNGLLVERGGELLRQYITLVNELQDWEHRAVRLCRDHGPMSVSEASAVDPIAAGGPPGLDEFCTLYGNGFFTLCTQYWAFCLKVYVAAQAFCELLLSAISKPDHTHLLPTLPAFIDPARSAWHIANNTPYFFRSGAGLWSAQSAVFPVGAALHYYASAGRRDSPMFKKMTEAFKDSKTGLIMGDFVHKIANSK